MVGSLFRLAAAVCFSLALTACASTGGGSYGPEGVAPIRGARVETPAKPLQCVPYARERSGIAIFGDAGIWWEKTAGHYLHGSTPLLGSIMVLTGYAGPGRAHLAVVASQVSDREITVDHANWLNDGAIYRDDPVVDVSADHNWSEVRIYNPRARAWGAHTYIVQGFIGPGPDTDEQRVASSE